MNDQKQTGNQAELVGNIVRGFGAVMMLGGVAVAFNLGGFAEMLFPIDGFLEKLLGGMLVVLGAIDFFLIPKFLKNLHSK